MAYGLGKALDVYLPHQAASGPGPAPVVLLWHGIGLDERDVLEPLARATAAYGVVVFVPDWRSDEPDGGRAHLLSSLAFVRQQATQFGGRADAIVLAGWSRGGNAAAALAVNPAAVGGWRPMAVVSIASGFSTPAAMTGTAPAADLAELGTAPVPFWLVHGTSDLAVDVSESRKFATLLAEHGWPVQLEELATDHAGVVMTESDPERQRLRSG